MEIYRHNKKSIVAAITGEYTSGIEMQKAASLAESYSKALGVCSFIIDNSGKLLFDTNGEEHNCTFCEKIRALLGDKVNCKYAHLYGGYQAERNWGKYTFFCPIGLVHWASPLLRDDMFQGAIISGPVLIHNPEEFLFEFIQKYEIEQSHIAELRSLLRSVPQVDPDKLESYSQLLHTVAESISTGNPTAEEKSENSEIQPKVSDYIYYLRTMGGDDDAQIAYPLEKENVLLEYIANGDKKGARKTLNEILGHVFFSKGKNFDVVKARVLELVVLLSRAALKGGAEVEEIFGLNYHYLQQINQFTTVEQLASWLARIMNRFSDLVFNLTDVKHVDVIFKALDYIRKNYMNKISLQDVAEAANISPSYFSKVFKDEMRCNFNVYLNQYRVEVAKKLLMDISIPLVNVAFLTGFEDQSYFSKVFKKITGMSPGKYRESMGRCREKTG
jgi:YesN/AraC family two-component response regulator